MNLADLVEHIDLPETHVAERAWVLARRRQRRRHAAVTAASAALVLAVVGVSALSLGDEPARPRPAGTDPTPSSSLTSGPSPSGIDHDPLTDHEFAVAVAVARGEIERLDLGGLVTSATATVGEGTVTDSNTGHPCASGSLLHVKLIGDFGKILHGSMPGQTYEPTSAVSITADPQSGQACLIGVATGEQSPQANAVVLFPPCCSWAQS